MKVIEMRILVVDDEKDMQVLFEQSFRREIRNGETEFTFAYSGMDALDYLDGQDHEVVLVLSDINMPGMNGIELLKRIRSKFTGTTPLVMMITAYGDQENYHNAMQSGAQDLFTKPLDFKRLKEKIKSVLS